MKIAPSILSADFGKLKEEIEMLNQSEADWIHVDVMDGRFVPNISFGFPVFEVLVKYASKPLDVHLMIEEPEKYASRFAEMGAFSISFHLEACHHSHRLLSHLRDLNVLAGVAINPQTGLGWLPNLEGMFDLVNVMTVNPGFGGQKFIVPMEQKIKQLHNWKIETGHQFEIEVDGGVNAANLHRLKEIGVTVAVAGAAVFGTPDPIQTLAEFKK